MTAPSADSFVLLMVLVIAGTLLLRNSFVFLFGRLDEIPEEVERVLRFVPAAVMAALVAQALVVSGDSVSISVVNPRLLAGAVAAAVAWRTENMLATLAVGMVALWTLNYLV